MKFKFILVALLMSLCAHAQTGQTVTSGQAVISGQTTAAAALPPTFAITTPSLANANSGQAYPGATIQTVNGVGAVSCNNPSGMPAGITINSACQVAGTSSSPGLYSFTVVATDTSTPTPQTASHALSITVNCAGLSITSPPTLPSGTQSVLYSYQLLKQGGVSPFNWSLASGSMPASCSIPSTGLISCTPSSNGTFNPNIQVVDSCPLGAQTSTLNATVVIAATPPLACAISTTSLPSATVGTGYSQNLATTNCTAPLQWSAPSAASAPGTVDMLNYWLMSQPDRASFHMAGGSNPRYSVLNAGMAMGIKSSGGMPQDGRWYDGSFLYFGTTDDGDSADQQACINAGFPGGCFLDPSAYKIALNLRPFSPRYFVLGGPDVTINDPAPNMGVSTTNCGADNHTPRDLGNVAVVIHDAGSGTNWGGDVGSCHTVIFNYYRSLTTLTPPYQSGSRERYYGCVPFGVFNYDSADWNGTSYGPPFQFQNLNNLKVAGGAPTPNFACTIPNPPVAGLPNGVRSAASTSLNINDVTGNIIGTPSVAGNFPFTAQVQDATGAIAVKALSISVNPASGGGSIISNASCGKTPGGMDGPAHKPLLYVCSSEADTPRTGAVISVPSGGNLQTAYNNAPCGADMQLAAGGVYTITTMTWSGKSCPGTQWIWIRTAPNANQPTEGNTQSPCNANVVSLVDYVPSPYTCPAPHAALATIVINPNGSWKVPGDHIRIENIELKKAAGTVVYNMLDLSSSSHVVVDRLWIHGNPNEEVSRGIFLDGASNVAVVDNFFSDIHCISAIGAGCDGQNIAATSAPGPFKVSRNFLSSGGEQIIFGGGGFATGVPSDIELTYNHTFRPCTWNPLGCRGVAYNGGVSGHPYVVKNQFEFKNAQRVWMRGNRFENNWGGFTQVGNNTTVSPKNQAIGTSSLCPQCLTKDIIEEFDFHLYFAQLFQVFNGGNANRAFAAEGNTYSFHDVLGIHARYTGCSGGCAPYLMELSTDPQAPVGFLMHHVTFNHIAIHTDTFTGQALMSLGGPPAPSTQQSNLVMENSILPAGNYGIQSIGGTTQCAYQQTISVPMLAKCWFPLTFDHNGLPWGSGHGGNWVSLPNPPDTSIKIADQNAVNYANVGGDTVADYALSPSSPFHNAGNDGKDLGPDITTLATEIAKTPY